MSLSVEGDTENMIICASEFLQEDRNNPGFSMGEVDYYAWIPAASGFRNHRLSLRKNLVTQEYEFVRVYNTPQIMISRGPLTLITNRSTGQEEVAFKTKDLQEALTWGNKEWTRFHGQDREPDKVCTHQGRTRATFCKVDEEVTTT